MANSNGKITAPVSISDISQVLGTTQDLTRSPNINRWAKFKPVRATFNLGSRPSDWWKADDGWCGLSIANAKISSNNDVPNIASKYTADKNNGWDYLPPRKGTDASRALDFAGYNHNVDPFVAKYTMPAKWSPKQGNVMVSFVLTMTGDDAADYLTYSDLPFNNYYLGVALISMDGTKSYRCTNSTTVENSGFNVEFNASNIAEGQYSVYPFFSSIKMGILDGNVGNAAAEIYTIPNVAPTTFVRLNDDIQLGITGIWATMADANGTWTMTYTVEIINNTQAARTFNTNYIQLRYNGKKFTDTLGSDEKQAVLNNGNAITVNADSSKRVMGIFSGIVPALRNDAIIWVSLNSSDILESAKPLNNVIPNE